MCSEKERKKEKTCHSSHKKHPQHSFSIYSKSLRRTFCSLREFDQVDFLVLGFLLSFFENVHMIAEERDILFFQSGILGHMPKSNLHT